MKSQRFFQHDTKNGKRWGYRREYKGRQLRRLGFETKVLAEDALRQAMDDLDALSRGEVKAEPTTMTKALELYTRKLTLKTAEKDANYGRHAKSRLTAVKAFIVWFGANKLVRELVEDDLREYYQTLCFRVSKASAKYYMSLIDSMLMHANKNRPDLATWLRPKLRDISKKALYDKRAVRPEEYRSLVDMLRAPTAEANLNCKGKAVWRDAADVVQILRNVGCRLSEALKMEIAQFNFMRRTVKVKSSKTGEKERDVPMTASVLALVQARIREGLTQDCDGINCPLANATNGVRSEVHTHLFPRVLTNNNYDRRIQTVTTDAASIAKLEYGQEHGFTLHSMRHTFITDLLLKTKDIAGTMKLSGHSSLEAFSKYLHLLDTSYARTVEVLESVDGILTGAEVNGVNEVEEVGVIRPFRPQQNVGVAVA